MTLINQYLTISYWEEPIGERLSPLVLRKTSFALKSIGLRVCNIKEQSYIIPARGTYLISLILQVRTFRYLNKRVALLNVQHLEELEAYLKTSFSLHELTYHLDK